MSRRRVLITGGSKGIGRAAAGALAERGWRVVLLARGAGALEGARRELPGEGHEVFAMDVTDETGWERLGPHLEDVHGLVCAAAVLDPVGPIGSYAAADFRHTLDVNVVGTLLAIRACLPGLRASGGAVVTFGGGGAAAPLPRFDAYAASKAAVVRLSENIAVELAGQGVRINCVAPGFVATDIHQATLAAGPELAGADYFERTHAGLKRGGAPVDEAAELVCLLLEEVPDAPFTGKLISARWDPWRDPGFRRRLVDERDLATLRRVADQPLAAIGEEGSPQLMPTVRSHPDPVGVVGLWHLGSVTAACLADFGYRVLGVDPDSSVVEGLVRGRPVVHEPGLPELLARAAEHLSFSTDPELLAGTKCAWITFDTPLDDDDNADVEWVMARSEAMLARLPGDALVIVSAQLPVGSVARLQARCAARRGEDDLRFACVPENLRLGSALDSFRAPDRIVAGVRTERDRQQLAEMLAPFRAPVEWMRVESAEMSKHALNGFLAASVAFANEIAAVCELVGADAEEVSRALRSDRRIGPRAYLAPGDSFAGGTLARDIGFLRCLAAKHGLPAHVVAGVADGNAAHRHWTRRKLLELIGHGEGEERPFAGATVAVWGLTYKPGTDTLRRSTAIELCRWLTAAGAQVRAHDPAVTVLPAGLAGDVKLCASPLDAAAEADALVVCTQWPDYREIAGEEIRSALAQGNIIDPAGWLQPSVASLSELHYVRVGTPSKRPQALPSKPS